MFLINSPNTFYQDSKDNTYDQGGQNIQDNKYREYHYYQDYQHEQDEL